jgi:hypothetical protein
MKLLFRILKSSLTDRLAYLSAVVGALCWLIHARYPALFPGPLRATAPIYTTIAASLTAGLLIAKYVFMEGYLRLMQEGTAEKDAFAAMVQRLEGAVREITEERDRISERESVLKNKLKNFENSVTEAQLSSLRKKIRSDEEDRETSLAYLARDLRNHLEELDHVNDEEIARAVAVLKKEIQMLGDAIKKGEMSLYELVLTINEIREHTYDLTLIRLQSGVGQEESVRDHQQIRDFPWFYAETDPSRIDRIFKFLKVAFHPDRFSSEGLKEEAKIHFQEAIQAYNSLKERLRATH